jgi:hypothetical protein
MRIGWQHPTSAIAYGVAGDFWNGHVYLQLTRLSTSPPAKVMMVADADGPVRGAFMQATLPSKGCTFIAPDAVGFGTLREGKFIGSIYGDDPNVTPEVSFAEAMFGAAFDELRPHVLGTWTKSQGHAIAVSSTHYAAYTVGGILIAPWGGAFKWIYPVAGVPGGSEQTSVVMWANLAFWASGDVTYYNQLAWQPGGGPYPFFYFGSDVSRGASGLGTDLTDMVWTYRDPGGVSVMTAPHGTDPSQLNQRRLRSYNADVIAPWIVGCGHAAHATGPGKIMIVRLNDGFSWTLSTSTCQGPNYTNGYCFGNVVALSCGEAFVTAGPNGQPNILRLRYDALGPGTAPD